MGKDQEESDDRSTCVQAGKKGNFMQIPHFPGETFLKQNFSTLLCSTYGRKKTLGSACRRRERGSKRNKRRNTVGIEQRPPRRFSEEEEKVVVGRSLEVSP